jgi:hypothetical protein
MLAGMNHCLFYAALAERAHHKRGFHKVRSGAHNVKEVHVGLCAEC